jgi:hypothetical protein
LKNRKERAFLSLTQQPSPIFSVLLRNRCACHFLLFCRLTPYYAPFPFTGTRLLRILLFVRSKFTCEFEKDIFYASAPLEDAVLPAHCRFFLEFFSVTFRPDVAALFSTTSLTLPIKKACRGYLCMLV